MYIMKKLLVISSIITPIIVAGVVFASNLNVEPKVNQIVAKSEEVVVQEDKVVDPTENIDNSEVSVPKSATEKPIAEQVKSEQPRTYEELCDLYFKNTKVPQNLLALGYTRNYAEAFMPDRIEDTFKRLSDYIASKPMPVHIALSTFDWE